MKVIVLYLTSGQILVGKKQNTEGYSVVLADPYELMAAPTGDGRVQVGYMGYGSAMGVLPRLELVTFTSETFVTWVEAPKRVEEGYLRASSGLVIGGA